MDPSSSTEDSPPSLRPSNSSSPPPSSLPSEANDAELGKVPSKEEDQITPVMTTTTQGDAAYDDSRTSVIESTVQPGSPLHTSAIPAHGIDGTHTPVAELSAPDIQMQLAIQSPGREDEHLFDDDNFEDTVEEPSCNSIDQGNGASFTNDLTAGSGVSSHDGEEANFGPNAGDFNDAQTSTEGSLDQKGRRPSAVRPSSSRSQSDPAITATSNLFSVLGRSSRLRSGNDPPSASFGEYSKSCLDLPSLLVDPSSLENSEDVDTSVEDEDLSIGQKMSPAEGDCKKGQPISSSSNLVLADDGEILVPRSEMPNSDDDSDSELHRAPKKRGAAGKKRYTEGQWYAGIAPEEITPQVDEPSRDLDLSSFALGSGHSQLSRIKSVDESSYNQVQEKEEGEPNSVEEPSDVHGTDAVDHEQVAAVAGYCKSDGSVPDLETALHDVQGQLNTMWQMLGEDNSQQDNKTGSLLSRLSQLELMVEDSHPVLRSDMRVLNDRLMKQGQQLKTLSDEIGNSGETFASYDELRELRSMFTDFKTLIDDRWAAEREGWQTRSKASDEQMKQVHEMMIQLKLSRIQDEAKGNTKGSLTAEEINAIGRKMAEELRPAVQLPKGADLKKVQSQVEQLRNEVIRLKGGKISADTVTEGLEPEGKLLQDQLDALKLKVMLLEQTATAGPSKWSIWLCIAVLMLVFFCGASLTSIQTDYPWLRLLRAQLNSNVTNLMASGKQMV